MSPKFLIIAGEGINCEVESNRAVVEAGGFAEIVQVNDLISRKKNMRDYDALILPGGFSFGDELGSGQILALKLKTYLKSEIEEFISKKLILGICNGFQVLMKLGVFNIEEKLQLSLCPNQSGHFINKNVSLQVEQNHCAWTRYLTDKQIELPIRNGEGRVVLLNEIEGGNLLDKYNMITFKYTRHVNGSYKKIAGLCNKTGRILGMMPHPESRVFDNRSKKLDYGIGYYIFKSAVDYIKETRRINDKKTDKKSIDISI